MVMIVVVVAVGTPSPVRSMAIQKLAVVRSVGGGTSGMPKAPTMTCPINELASQNECQTQVPEC